MSEHCDEPYPDRRFRHGCTKPSGHDGPHGYAGMFWGQEPVACSCDCHKPKHEARPPHPLTQIGRRNP